MRDPYIEKMSGKVERQMEKHVYRFADHTVEISSLHPYVHRMCGDYRTEDSPELFLSVSQSDIDGERRRSAEEALAGSARDRSGSDAYLETLAVYRKIAEGLIEDGVLLFHGSAVAVDGACYLFAAKSGTGKSTHARLWRELLGQRAVMVNDDKPLLKISGAGVTVYGTPWDGKHHLSRNISVPLRAVCILERGTVNSMEPVSAKEAWPLLWRQSYRPSDPEKLKRTMVMTDTLSKTVRLYRLRCTPDIQAARLAYETMRKGASL